MKPKIEETVIVRPEIDPREIVVNVQDPVTAYRSADETRDPVIPDRSGGEHRDLYEEAGNDLTNVF